VDPLLAVVLDAEPVPPVGTGEAVQVEVDEFVPHGAVERPAGVVITDRLEQGQLYGEAHRRPGRTTVDGPHAGLVGAEKDPAGALPQHRIRQAGWVIALEVAVKGDHLWLVDGAHE